MNRDYKVRHLIPAKQGFPLTANIPPLMWTLAPVYQSNGAVGNYLFWWFSLQEDTAKMLTITLQEKCFMPNSWSPTNCHSFKILNHLRVRLYLHCEWVLAMLVVLCLSLSCYYCANILNFVSFDYHYLMGFKILGTVYM